MSKFIWYHIDSWYHLNTTPYNVRRTSYVVIEYTCRLLVECCWILISNTYVNMQYCNNKIAKELMQ